MTNENGGAARGIIYTIQHIAEQVSSGVVEPTR